MQMPQPERGQGIECQLAGDTHALTTDMARIQYLGRFGVPLHRAALVADLAFGEARP